MRLPHGRLATASIGFGVVCALAFTATGSATTTPADGATDSDRVRCATGQGRQADFTAASRAAGVPKSVLLAVSYLESRWDDHAGSPSTALGYGPMHLTDAPADLKADGRGDGVDRLPLLSTQTLRLASELTGLSTETLKADPGANICGGAALLASLQRQAGGPVGADTDPAAWADAVAAYSGSGDPATAGRFVRQVYTVLRDGAARTTIDGETVRLAAHPSVAVPTSSAASTTTAEQTQQVDCPASLGCWWIPAPYQWYGEPNPYRYGNHDLGNRPNDLAIDYIIVHDTEATWATTLRLVTDPRYVSWQYSLRSSDGQIAQHLKLDDVGWHAGNWYVNMHSIGLEHEGFAAHGASWYTEAMYQTSAELVRYLTARYDIPRDRAHIIGHDQIPGITPAHVRGMHWDPGPYWDWEHYMDLIGAPIKPDRRSRSDIWTVAPGFADNVQPMTGCDRAGEPCEPQGTNFVYIHSQPDADSPLVSDIGLRPDGSPSTRHVSDIGARAAAGQKFVVTERVGDWVHVWWLGNDGWIHSPESDPVLVPSDGYAVTPREGLASAPVYGRAYPEASAYPSTIPYQSVIPLQYTIKPGQSYVLADADLETDYYYAKTYNCAYVEDDCTQVLGQDRYYNIWFGHRMAYVRAADVHLVEH